MAVDDDDLDPQEMPGVTDPELRRMLGLYDAPAFARRGHDLQHVVGRLVERCRARRAALLAMVRLRLRQWAALAVGPDDWSDAFDQPVAPLYEWAGAGAPDWATAAAPARRRRIAARDLASSLRRFNRAWERFIRDLDLKPLNRLIEDYNRYYVLEKECVLGSSRLAARHFAPEPLWTAERLLAEFPTLLVPGVRVEA
jgi:hypothetical protein